MRVRVFNRVFNGWVRLGIVATVLWVVGSYFYCANDAEQNADEYSTPIPQGASPGPPPGATFDAPLTQATSLSDLSQNTNTPVTAGPFASIAQPIAAVAAYKAATAPSTAPSIIWGETAVRAAMVIPGWLSVIVVLWAVRWVRRGFVKKPVRGDSDLEFRGMRTW